MTRYPTPIAVGVLLSTFVVVAACSDSGDGCTGSVGTPPISMPLPAAPRAVKEAKTTTLAACTVYVDAANTGKADGTATNPHTTITAAVAAATPGAVICVAQGTYAEALAPGTKYFTLAGGFQSQKDFKVRDSSLYVTKAQGDGSNTFLSIADPGPTANQLTAVDGFEITGYAQGIVRSIFYAQRFDITNDFIHDNDCNGAKNSGQDDEPNGGGFFLNNVSGTISGNVFANNTCARGGAGALVDSTNSNAVTLRNNLVDSNVGDERGSSHGGGLYLFAKTLTLTANEFVNNSVTGWGGGLYIGADTGSGQATTATLSWNVYRDNRAGIYGGGFFCDDSAHCNSDHELYDKNCGGNVYLDSGGAGGTIATFDHLTSSRGLAVGCGAPGPGVVITKDSTANDSYTFTNAIFWGNAKDRDFDASCEVACGSLEVAISYSTVQTKYASGGMGVAVTFGIGNVSGDPLFVGADDFHLQSTRGHWAPNGYVLDTASSPALMTGDPAGATADNPERAGTRTEMGTYGNSVEASLTR